MSARSRTLCALRQVGAVLGLGSLAALTAGRAVESPNDADSKNSASTNQREHQPARRE